MADATPVRNEAIIDLLSEHRRPMHAGELAARLRVAARHRLALHEALEALVFDGVLTRLPGRRYRLAAGAAEGRDQRVEGTIAINPRGFGFVSSPELADDLHLSANAVRGADHRQAPDNSYSKPCLHHRQRPQSHLFPDDFGQPIQSIPRVTDKAV